MVLGQMNLSDSCQSLAVGVESCYCLVDGRARADRILNSDFEPGLGPYKLETGYIIEAVSSAPASGES